MFSRRHTSVRKRSYLLEGLEDRQLMAGDLAASLENYRPFIRPTAGNNSVQTAKESTQFDGQISAAQLSSTTTATPQATSTATVVGDLGTITDGGIIDDPSSPYVPPTVELTYGDIRINGSNRGDNAKVSIDGSYYHVEVNGTIHLFKTSAVTGGDVFFNGWEGNDTFYNAPTSQLRVFAYGMEGNDTLTGGGKNDYLYGGLGADTLNGGAGKDTIYTGVPGGTDFSTNHANGGDGDDTLNGSQGTDYLNGDRGNDKIYGFAGLDYLNGGDNDDIIEGGLGEDYLSGNNGNDKLWACSPNQSEYSQNFFDGGAHNDVLFGSLGADFMAGMSGNDELIGSGGNDYLNGGTGKDRLYGGSGDDQLDGGGIDGELDSLFGGADSDTFLVIEHVGGIFSVSVETTDFKPGIDVKM